MSEVATLYVKAGRVLDKDVSPISYGDLKRSIVHEGGRIQLPDGRWIRAEDLPFHLEAAEEQAKRKLTKKERLAILRKGYDERRKARGPVRPSIRKTTRIMTTPGLWANASKPGAVVGWAETTGKKERPHIYTAGPVQIGADTFIVCAAPGYRHIFLGRNGRIMRLSGHSGYGNPQLNKEATDPSGLDEPAKQLWADSICRQVLDLYTSIDISESIGSMGRRYGLVLRAHLEGCVVDCASVGIERSMLDFVQAADGSFEMSDVFPVYPTIKHALYLSLAMDLPTDPAVLLIMFAAFTELRLPIIQREVALAMYLEARRQLGILCPQWVIHGKRTDWRQLGTNIAHLMRLQFFRMVNDAEDRGIALEAAAGLRLAVTQLGETAMAGSYSNRTLNPDIGLGILNELKKVKPEDVETVTSVD